MNYVGVLEAIEDLTAIITVNTLITNCLLLSKISGPCEELENLKEKACELVKARIDDEKLKEQLLAAIKLI